MGGVYYMCDYLVLVVNKSVVVVPRGPLITLNPSMDD